MRRQLVLAACASALMLVPLAAWDQAKKPESRAVTIKREPAKRLISLEGADIFREYCAVCHGREGKGNGPAAAALKKPPADLTTITKRHGQFPRKTIEETILAENEPTLMAHGNREMPIWGPIFRQSGGRDVEALAVANLLKYLESIQVK